MDATTWTEEQNKENPAVGQKREDPLGPESVPGRLAWPNPFGIR